MAQEFGIVVVGAGIGGGQVVESLRNDGFAGTIALVGADPLPPYYRPDLSKKLMLEDTDPGDSELRGEDWYAAHDVETFFADAATKLDTASRTVTLASGDELSYGQAILATGSTPRTLDVPGTDLANVHTLRSAGDAVAIRSQFGEGRKVVIVGGGWIGLEVAAAARSHGSEVTVVVRDAPPLKAVLGEEMGRYFEELHVSHGVTFFGDAEVTGFTGDGAVETAQTTQGDIPADLVVIGIGADPTVDLAEAAGIDVDNGVPTDERMRTSEGNVLAIGDIANAFNTRLDSRIRVEHWDNAVRQADVAASTLTGGTAVYDWEPYFFTDQYDLGMEYVGHGSGDDEVTIRGDKDSGEFIVFWTKDGTLTAAMNVNIWDVSDELRALIGKQVDTAKLADEAVPLSEL
ncbi:FAD-dependent oxidoreductase [Brevibacterium casei]|uniref:NAD(P)/FAD-dependent oxidoreductase n=1 Tax=Brevibacterium casei TaxID=33889 RepID=UPI00344ED670